MTERRGDTLLFHTPPVIAAQAAVGGKKESDGPLAAGFDELTTDNRLGQCSWEAAEKQLQLRAARLCLQKAALPAERVDLALAGDLQAQCTASGYALRELGVPFAGLFGRTSVPHPAELRRGAHPYRAVDGYRRRVLPAASGRAGGGHCRRDPWPGAGL